MGLGICCVSLLCINLPAVHQCLMFAGLYGQSTVREVDLLSGSILRQQALPASDFGEGLVKFGSR